MNLLEKALEMAVKAHEGQRDKAGMPYMFHPLRVMLRMDTETEMITALLHDVVEDSDWSIEKLREEGFSEEVRQAVDCLTRRAGETYAQFIDRAKQNPLARKVKLADLEDNMDLRRLPQPSKRDFERLTRYQHALATLKIEDD